MPSAIRKLAERYITNPHQIRIDPARLTVAETEQRVCVVHEEKKMAALTRMLEVDEVSSALIFARTKARTQELSDELNRRGIHSAALHGDLNQDRREAVLGSFRTGAVTLLVATDVAARGLDIENVSHVFNFDVPADPEDYVHRIGRTGRAGRKGIAVTFLTPRERGRLKMIESYTKQALVEVKAPKREEVMAKRDQIFHDRMTDLIAAGGNPREKALVARLLAEGNDPTDIALAAMRLARSAEMEVPADETQPVMDARSTRTRRDDGPRRNDRPTRDFNRGTEYGRNTTTRKDSRLPLAAKGSNGNDAAPTGGEMTRQPGMVRLKMNLGNAHGLRPGDVVGAIASEVGIPGRAIGDIVIRRTHTFVDVAEKHVREVLQQSTGQYQLYGKPVLLKLAH
jgi:ATP-dependent RNA helicase DeaD